MGGDDRMKDSRRYQRYTVDRNADKLADGEVTIEGELVQLVDFSLSGLCVLSKIPFTSEPISVSVEFEKRGRIDLIGKVVRAVKEEDMWRISIDLTETYKYDTLRKV
jgi:hypothetical protein